MRDALVILAWVAGIAVLLAAVAYVVLKWLALRIAKRVAETTEARFAASMERGIANARRRAVPKATEEQQRRYLAQVDRLAKLMDRIVPLPIVGGIGLDAVLGLFPVAGDAISTAISSIIVIRAAQLGAPPDLLSRLVAIQCTDLVLGAVPVLGDLVDIAYQADLKSARLIREFMALAPTDQAGDVARARPPDSAGIR